jgi:hypothetical protein
LGFAGIIAGRTPLNRASAVAAFKSRSEAHHGHHARLDLRAHTVDYTMVFGAVGTVNLVAE